MTKILVYLFFIIFFCPFYLFSQQDFVISLKMDTLYGKISSYETKEIRFVDTNNRKHRLLPEHILGFQYNGKQYISTKAGGLSRFAEFVINDYPISVLKIEEKVRNRIMKDGYSDGYFDEKILYHYYYWNQEMSNYRLIKQYTFHRQAKRYFANCPILNQEINQYKYGFDSLRYIVNKYNNCKQ